MLIKNMDDMNVNGSMGTIVDFVDPNGFEMHPGNAKPESKPTSNGAPKDGKLNAGVGTKYPVVEFTNPTRRLLIQPETWKVESADGEVQVSRTQVRGRRVPDINFWLIL